MARLRASEQATKNDRGHGKRRRAAFEAAEVCVETPRTCSCGDVASVRSAQLSTCGCGGERSSTLQQRLCRGGRHWVHPPQHARGRRAAQHSLHTGASRRTSGRTRLVR